MEAENSAELAGPTAHKIYLRQAEPSGRALMDELARPRTRWQAESSEYVPSAGGAECPYMEAENSAELAGPIAHKIYLRQAGPSAHGRVGEAENSVARGAERSWTSWRGRELGG